MVAIVKGASDARLIGASGAPIRTGDSLHRQLGSTRRDTSKPASEGCPAGDRRISTGVVCRALRCVAPKAPRHPGPRVLLPHAAVVQGGSRGVRARCHGISFSPTFDDVVRAANGARADNAEMCVPRAVEAEIGDRLPLLLHDILTCFVQDARSGLNLKKMAASLHMSERSIIRRLQRHGISARAQIAWGQMLVAARIMRHEGRTLEEAALKLSLAATS